MADFNLSSPTGEAIVLGTPDQIELRLEPVAQAAITLSGGLTGPVGPQGDDGNDGREIELQTSATHIQWRYVGDPSWTNLIDMTLLEGPQGDDGADGDDGINGDDGREVELQSSGTHIQWRYLGDVSWVNLIALSAITGPAGTDGTDGAPGPSDHTLLTNIGTNTHAQIDTAISASASHIANSSNPHSTTKAQVGLSNVPNLDTTTAVAQTHTHANSASLALVSGTNTGDQDLSGYATTSALTTGLAGKANTTHAHVATTDLTATGTKDSTTFLRGDDTWATPPTGGGGTNATNLTATLSATNAIINSDTGTDATIPAVDGTNAGVMTPAQKTKLDGIATGATANTGDVVGPASSTQHYIPTFDDTTGKLLKQSGVSIDPTDNHRLTGTSATFPSSVTTNTVNEYTSNLGVTVDSVLLKDGLVDGRDVATDGTKLDGIEAAADVTDAANVAAAGAIMDGDFSANGSMHRTAAGTYTSRTITGTTNLITVTNGDGVSGNPTITVGSNVYRSGGTDVSVADGGTGRSTSTTAYGLIAAGTTPTGAHQTIAPGTSGQFLKSAGASALASFATITKSDVGLASVDNTADTAKNVDKVDGLDANSTATANTLYPLNANTKFPFTVLGTTRLSTTETTDFVSGVALTANTWTDFKANQTFTVGSSSSIIMFIINCNSLVGTSAAAISARLVIDSAGTPINRTLGGMSNVGGTFNNPFTMGFAVVTGLSAGSHTVKSQVISQVGNTAYCRPATVPSEFYSTTVIEIGG